MAQKNIKLHAKVGKNVTLNSLMQTCHYIPITLNYIPKWEQYYSEFKHIPIWPSKLQIQLYTNVGKELYFKFSYILIGPENLVLNSTM